MLKRSLRMAVVAGCSGLALFATACSGSSGSTGDEGTGKESGGGQHDSANDGGKAADEALKLRKCLREHGIDIPDPKPGQDPRGLTLGGGEDPAKFEKALKQCGGGTGRKGGGELSQAEKDQMLAHAQCMREHGIDMPDPKFEGGGAKGQAMQIPDGDKAKFEKANKACSKANG